ncbi:hypothetical protein [Winogradskyella sp.]|uniref:hypothetical protein n=1 Tax=Winogradskyella sp. TaxID=1883156 RepID=UPI003BA91DCC
MLITSIKYSKDKHTSDCQYALSDNKTTITINEDLIKEFHSLRIEFDCDIALIRHHDYKWINSSQPSLSNWYSPKILKLKNGVYVQANTPKGIWQYSPKEKHVLLWHFNVEFSKPMTHYSGNRNAKQIVQSTFLQFKVPLELLMSKKGAVEFSRSKIPFKAIACFTDHCDFDTEENLILQREFLKNTI